MTLLELFEQSKNYRPGDIYEHLTALSMLAATCNHITEFGTSKGVSTTALLLSKPAVLHTYDITRHTRVAMLEQAAGEAGVRFVFHLQDTGTLADIEETDLLFIDTWHVGTHVVKELRHAARARRYLAFHDFETFGVRGEGGPGMLPVLLQFLKEHPEWAFLSHYENNNGLTLLQRVH